MSETRSTPVATTRKGVRATSTSILKGCCSLAFLLVFLLAAVGTASATSVVTTTTLQVGFATSPTSSISIAQYSQSLTLTATVSGANAAGTVNFTNKGVTIVGCGSQSVSSGSATCTTTASNTLPVGANTLKAAFAPQSNSWTASSTATAYALAITAFTPTTTLTISPAASEAYGTSVTLSASVGAALSGKGTVNFAYTAADATTPTPICPGVNNVPSTGIVTCTTTAPPVGANAMKAVFIPGSSYTTEYASSTSSPVTYTVSANPTTVTLTSLPASPATYATSVTLTATVAQAAGTVAPKGTVNFTNGGTTITGCGTQSVSTSGAGVTTATCVTKALPVAAPNALSAVFTPYTTNYTGSTGTANFTVTGITPAITLAGTGAAYGTTVTLTAGAIPAVAGTGAELLDAVTFTYGTSATAASDTSPVTCTGGVTITPPNATCNTNMLPVTATYVVATFTPSTAAAANYSAASFSSAAHAITMTKAVPTVTLATSPSINTQVGASVTLTATLPSAMDTGAVAFSWAATSAAGTAISACSAQSVSTTAGVTAATCTTTAPTAAAASAIYVKAVYSPTAAVAANFNTATFTSNTPSFKVVATATATTAVSPSAGPYYYGSPLSLSATVSEKTIPVTYPASATVTFYDNGVALKGGIETYNSTTGVATLPQVTTLSGAPLAVGTHSITASTAGTSSDASSSSVTPVSFTIGDTPTTTTVWALPLSYTTNATTGVPAPLSQVLTTSPPSTYPANNSFTLYAIVVPNTSIAAGNTAVISGGHVSFYDVSTSASTLLGTANLVLNGNGTAGIASYLVNCPAATANCSTRLALGNHHFLASYGGVFLGTGAAQYAGSMSPTVLLAVVGTPTLTITASSPTVTYGSPVPLITPSYSISTATGGTLASADVSSCTTADLGVTYTCTALPSMTTAPVCTIGGTGYTPTTAKGATGITTTCTAKDSNYTVQTVAGTVTVTGAGPAWSNFNAQTVTYGTAINFPVSTSTSPVASTITTNSGGAITFIKCSTTPCTSSTSGYTAVSGTPASIPDTTLPGTYYVTATVAAAGNFAAASTTRTMTVVKEVPTVTWPLPKAIPYGTALSSSTFGTCSAKNSSNVTVPGTCAWTTPTTKPDVGTSQSATFTPSASNNGAYAPVVSVIPVNVTPVTPTISAQPTATAVPSGSSVWANGFPISTITAGTAKFGTTTLTGTWSWTCSLVVPNTCGIIDITSSTPVSVTFTPSSTPGLGIGADFTTATGSATVTTLATVSVRTWPGAPGLTYGQPLSSSTLDNTGLACTNNTSLTTCNGSAVTGTFAWSSPALGGQLPADTFPPVGTDNECVTFTATGYAPVYSSGSTSCTAGNVTNSTVTVAVTAATPSVSWSSIPTTPLYTGQTLSNSSISPSTIANSYAEDSALKTGVTGTFAWDTTANDPASTTPASIGRHSYTADFNSTNANYNSITTTSGDKVYVTVNPCGLQDSTNSVYSLANSINNDVVTQIQSESPSVTQTVADESGICAVNGNPSDQTVQPSVFEPTIALSFNGSNPVDSTSFGTNAAVLAYGTSATAAFGSGATITITDSNGTGSGIPGSITTTGNYSSGVFASMGGTANVTNTNISTAGNHSRALNATFEGTLTINNAQATTTGSDSAVIATGTGSGHVTVNGGSYTAAGTTSTSGIRAAGTCPTNTSCTASQLSSQTGGWSTIVVNEASVGTTITANNGPVVAVEGGNSVTINGTSANLNSLSGTLGNNQGVFLYQSGTKTDATPATSGNPSAFTMKDGFLTYTCDVATVSSCAAGNPGVDQNTDATVFSVANTTALITLTDVTVTNNTNSNGDGILLTAAQLSTGPATVTFKAYGESLTGDVIVDSLSTANLVMEKDPAETGTVWTGTIGNGIYGDLTQGTVNLTLDDNSAWVITTTPTVTLNRLTETGTKTSFANVYCAATNSGCTVFIASPTGGQPASFTPATYSN